MSGQRKRGREGKRSILKEEKYWEGREGEEEEGKEEEDRSEEEKRRMGKE